MAYVKLDNASIEIPVYGVGGVSLKMTLLRRAIGARFDHMGSSNVTVHALKDVTLDAQDGDRIGIIGQNGSGKTTLLRVLAGVYPPTRGKVAIQGSISPMFDIALGMAIDATGMENIRICGALWGLTEKELDAGIDDVVEFTELGEYLNIPVRTYSNGMLLRLAFGIATLRKPEILLLDEIIGVGDAVFLKKAEARLRAIAEDTNILFLSSHSLEIIRQFCNKLIWLHQGSVIGHGDVETVIAQYLDAYTDMGGAKER